MESSILFTKAQVAHYYRRFPRIKQHGVMWRGPCPVHQGKNPNFAVDPVTGRCYCHSKCGRGWDLIGLEMQLTGAGFQEACDTLRSELGISDPAPARQVAETYAYLDEYSRLLFEVVRFVPKGFAQRSRDANGNSHWNVRNVRKVLYRLPELVRADPNTPVFLVEGEKDVHTLEGVGLLATTSPGGAGKWSEAYTRSLAKRDVVIIPDEDQPGISHALDVAGSLIGVVRSVKIVRLGEMPVSGPAKDVTDWFFAGGTFQKLIDQVSLSPVLTMQSLREVRELYAEETAAKPEAAEAAEPGPAVVTRKQITKPEYPPLPDGLWSGFLGRYRDLAVEATESPAAFHLASLLTVTGTLLGRSVWYENPAPVYGNLYALLIGQTAFARKSSSSIYARRLGAGTAAALSIPYQTLYGCASVEGLAQAMVNPNTGESLHTLVIEDEFRSLIQKGNQKAVSNLIPRLTELYSLQDTFQVNTRHERIEVNNPFVSLLANSTVEWFTDSLRANDIAGGFVNRWCVFGGCRTRIIPFAVQPGREDWARLAADYTELIQAAREHPGPRSWTDDAKALFTDFYQGMGNGASDPAIVQATSRSDVHALKFAMLFSVLAGRRSVGLEDMSRGIELAKWCAETVSRSLVHVGASAMGLKERKLLARLEAGRMSARDAYCSLHLTSEELMRIARGLEQSGLIRVLREKTCSGQRRVYLEAA